MVYPSRPQASFSPPGPSPRWDTELLPTVRYIYNHRSSMCACVRSSEGGGGGGGGERAGGRARLRRIHAVPYGVGLSHINMCDKNSLNKR